MTNSLTSDVTWEEARSALRHYSPKDKFGTADERRINAMRDAIRYFLKQRSEYCLNEKKE